MKFEEKIALNFESSRSMDLSQKKKLKNWTRRIDREITTDWKWKISIQFRVLSDSCTYLIMYRNNNVHFNVNFSSESSYIYIYMFQCKNVTSILKYFQHHRFIYLTSVTFRFIRINFWNIETNDFVAVTNLLTLIDHSLNYVALQFTIAKCATYCGACFIVTLLHY